MKHKLRRRTLTVLLALVLIIGMQPTTVFAANTATVQINGQVLQDNTPVQCGEGTAVLDEGSGTLTLNNATINQDTTNDYPVRVSNGDLKIILIGENTITSTNMKAFYGGSVNLTIQGTENDSLIIETNSDGFQVDNGNLTIDGCNINITSANWGGMICYGGTLTIQNSADITIDSFENSLIGAQGLFITDSTVNSTSRANYPTSAVHSQGNMSITNSTVTATSNGESANAIYNVGNISINNSEVVATTISQKGYEAICADGNIEIINHSSVTINSAGRIGVWSTGGSITIQDSIAYVTANDSWDAIRGSTGGATFSGSWIETFGSMVSPTFTSSDSVVFLNNTGTASGSLTLPGNVTVGANMQLSIPDDSSITVPAGVTFTNHGQIELLGALINNGGNIDCTSHVGGTATCTSKAVCDICGNEYGNLLPHKLIKTDKKDPTCTEDGNREYWTCEICGKIFSDANGETEITLADTVVAATGHSYQNGKCTVCGAIDTGFKDSITGTGETTFTIQATTTTTTSTDATTDKTQSPQTGDNSNITLWVTVMLAAGAGLTATTICRRKRYCKTK